MEQSNPKVEVRLTRKEDGTNLVEVSAKFNLGEATPKQEALPDGGMVIGIQTNVEGHMRVIEEVVLSSLKGGSSLLNEKGKLKSLLDDYGKLFLMSVIGVEAHPIRLDENGALTGFKEGWEVVVENVQE